MMKVEGDFYFNASSKRQKALLTINKQGFVTFSSLDGNDSPECPELHFSQLQISPRLGNTPRYISFENGSNFETLHNDKIDDLLRGFKQGTVHRFIHLLESHLLIVLLVVVFVSGFIWGSVKYAVPEIASISAQLLPVEVNQYLGQETLDILDRTVFNPSELAEQRKTQLTLLFERYASEYPELLIKIGFRKAENIGANAMALPGGQIIFTDELVDLAENDQELIAIFAHEIGHLYYRHMLRRIIQDSMLTVLVVLMTGDASSASTIVYAIPGLLLELAYSRQFELEADDFAYDFLISNDIETQHFANIMLRLIDAQQKMNKAEKVTLAHKNDSREPEKITHQLSPYLSTHPATEMRVQKFQTGP